MGKVLRVMTGMGRMNRELRFKWFRRNGTCFYFNHREEVCLESFFYMILYSLSHLGENLMNKRKHKMLGDGRRKIVRETG